MVQLHPVYHAGNLYMKLDVKNRDQYLMMKSSLACPA